MSTSDPESPSAVEKSERVTGPKARIGSAFDDGLIPKMNAESDFELIEEAAAPVRGSAFVCLLLGVASFVAVVGRPMLFVPALAFLVGLYAKRRYDGPRPVGLWAASLGMLLASGFGACGLALPYFKEKTLGDPAEYFAREYLELAANQNLPMSLELQRGYRNRNLATTSLEEAYKDYGETEDTQESLETMVGGPYGDIGALERKPEWKLVSRRVYHEWRIDKVNLLFEDTTEQITNPVQLLLECHYDKEGRAQYHVALFQYHRERLVAESIL
ncbi:MAG: hypothetical protein AAGD07_06420 [Planctomycetota bacterium]